ncbi:MAG TPA: SDR family oxidoreductase [Microvirga sp.]|jgi:NAD(P)-dependent dehydrogenase (short-subunit alcohol dehydrogenase family)
MAGQVLIYGGTGGIGAATARLLKARGYGVHLVARDAARLEALAREIGATTTAGDVADDALFARAAEEAGGALAGLVYAIGTINLKPFGRLTAQDFERDFRINAVGAARAVQAAMPALKAGEGTPGVVLFSTVAVAQGFASHASIGLAKGAVEGLALSLAAELAPKIRVNVVAPSLTRTPLAQALTANEAMASGIAQMHALQRLGTPEDVAAAAAFLLSDEASWITGQVLGVDGGRSSLRTKG